MANTCCEFGREIRDSQRVLYETDNFLVTPTFGSMGIEGWVLIAYKQHSHSMAAINLHDELRTVIRYTKDVIEREYGIRPRIFEHGHGRDETGLVVQHPHLHVVPKNFAFLPLVHDQGGTRKLYRYSFLSAEHTYLYAEMDSGYMTVTEPKGEFEPQVVRKLVAKVLESEEWDWRRHLDTQTFDATLERLEGKF